MKKEFLEEMKSSVKVKDRLSDDPEENSYININNMGCRLCSQDSDETQEHLQLCEGTKFERRGLDLSDWRGLLDFWRRMKIKMAAVT